MRAGILVRLSLAGGRTDTLRTLLTGASAALATATLLAAATVASIRGGEWVIDGDGNSTMAPGVEQYTSPLLQEAGLRPGVVLALLLLTLPVLALAGQCGRLGAPARDRRLAAIRLAGATPGQAVLIAVAETVVSSLLGSLAGLGVYLGIRRLLHDPGPDGTLPLPTDVLPSPVLMAMTVAVVPVLAGAIGVLLMRGVVMTPFGVVRHERKRGPRPWPGAAVLVGIGLVNLALWIEDRFDVPDTAVGVSLLSGVVLVMAGVVLGTGWISHTAGRLLHRFGRGPTTLLAGRRMTADPWNGSRTMSALLGAAVIGGIAAGYHAYFQTQARAENRLNTMMGYPQPPAEMSEFYVGAVRLVLLAVGVGVAVSAAGMLVALAESIMARRRTFAALTAAGTPGRTLAGSLLWQTVTPLIPAFVLAVGSGLLLTRSVYSEVSVGGGAVETCAGPGDCVRTVDPVVIIGVPVPWEQLALLSGGGLLAVLLVAGVGALVLRGSVAAEEIRVA
ncbi:FtsX-like permease family protein [Actinoplanes derwentensis]|uniref:FtsX-like permease family protein n=1 Tax=Actinoplanes derwentensis TaxID=113562 RepID=A0A1H2CRB1_9ACTN|nr:FtsX-like permease family protein [Actinoplanes derwentensis]GID90483.1 hypothetical protein Ade03nite_94070 [Actinoplanes derwentensis]SDT72884.1 FtsX-like permease family protein [Actinoplanes derwentensis]